MSDQFTGIAVTNPVTFGMARFVVEVPFRLAWIYNRNRDASFLFSVKRITVGLAAVIFFVGSLIYRARKKRELQAATPARAAVRSVDRNLTVYELGYLEQFQHNQRSGISAPASTMTSYSLIALILAVTGIQAVISHTPNPLAIVHPARLTFSGTAPRNTGE